MTLKLTAYVTFPKIFSGIGFRNLLSSLSKHVAISSIHIHTSDSVMKQPKHWTMNSQSCDLRTTSRSINILLFSSLFPDLRICWKWEEQLNKNCIKGEMEQKKPVLFIKEGTNPSNTSISHNTGLLYNSVCYYKVLHFQNKN